VYRGPSIAPRRAPEFHRPTRLHTAYEHFRGAAGRTRTCGLPLRRPWPSVRGVDWTPLSWLLSERWSSRCCWVHRRGSTIAPALALALPVAPVGTWHATRTPSRASGSFRASPREPLARMLPPEHRETHPRRLPATEPPPVAPSGGTRPHPGSGRGQRRTRTRVTCSWPSRLGTEPFRDRSTAMRSTRLRGHRPCAGDGRTVLLAANGRQVAAMVAALRPALLSASVSATMLVVTDYVGRRWA
jgi:hypothetical protein